MTTTTTEKDVAVSGNPCAVMQTLQSELNYLLSGRLALWAQNKTASPNKQLWVKNSLAVYCLSIFTPQ